MAKEKKAKQTKEKESLDGVMKAPPRGPLPVKPSANDKTSEVTLPAPARADLRVQLGAVKTKARAQ
jgi:hypothetical protein